MGLLDEIYKAYQPPSQPQPPRQWWDGLTPVVKSPQPLLFKPVKPKVFISYHHKDQVFVDNFKLLFGSAYEVFTDCSLDAAIESTDLHYVNRTIREDFITGTSITIVVCGTDTWKRKCVDWEIYSTLHKDHALLGIILPHVPNVLHNGQQGRVIPNRLYTNITSGYGHYIEYPQNALNLKQAIDHALYRAKQFKVNKSNSAAKMTRNAS